MFIGGRMATEQSTIEVNVLTKGLTEATASAQKLHDIMKATSNIAANIRIPTAVQAAQEQVAATNNRRSSPVMAGSTPKGGGKGNEYGTARGTLGTGAEGRDFAKQAQGLGGLVHVYATFAANLFAVSAAFSALSKAADTTNIIKGLDQLGAQSGRSLGGVAKAMVEVTGGALSLREAMTSTALASSAGMTNAAMIRMTEVAKKASLALGRDMGDSMDRLTKGIAKVQPELLDELGIMARVIPSQEKYARELGKSVSALTDFEKKQAFANAVLEEGERKFSSINIDTNPYTQLSASLANVAQTGLELVNTVLGPLASSLAKSPTALGLALTGIAGILLKQAIPALGQYRKGLEAVNAENLKKVSEMQKIQGEAGYDYDTKIVGERARKKYLVEKDFATKSLDEQKKITAQANKIADAAAEASAARATSLLGHETTTNKIRDRMYQTTAISGAKYNVSQIQGAYGMTAAFSQLSEEMTKLQSKTNTIDVGGGLMRQVPAINKFSAALVGISGAIAIIGTTIGTLINRFAPWIIAITAFASAVSFLIDYFKTATTAVNASAKALEGITTAAKTIGDTLDAIEKKPFLEQISNASVQAKAAAINELSSSLGLLVKRNKEASEKVAKGSYADSIGDQRLTYRLDRAYKVGDAYTSNLGRELADGTQQALVAASKLIVGSTEEATYRASIKNILGISYSDSDNLEKQLKNIPDELIKKLPKLQKSLEDTNKAINNAASAGKELDDAWTAATKTFDNLMTSLAITDPLGKLGDETIKVGIAMTKAFEDPANKLAELSKTSKDMSRLRFMSPETAKDMMLFAGQLDESAKKVDKLKEKLKTSRENENKSSKEVGMFGKFTDFLGITDNPGDLKKAQQESKNINKQIAAEANNVEYQKLYLKSQDEVFAKGAKLVNDSISQSFAKANIALSQTVLANAGNTKEGIRALADLAKQQIDVESGNLNAMLQLAIVTSELAKIQEEILIAEKRKELKRDNKDGNISNEDFKRQSSELTKRAIILETSREKQNASFKNNAADLNATGPGSDITRRAAQMNYPLVSMTESVRAQLALNTAKKMGIDIDAKGKEILLDIDAIIRRNDLISKGLSLKSAELGLLAQSSQYESEAAVLQKQSIDRSITDLAQEKERLNIVGQIKDAEMRASQATDPKTKATANASALKFRNDLADKEKQIAMDVQILDLKNIQELKNAKIAEFNYLKDFQLLNNTINTESLSAIQSTTSLYLDFVQQQKAGIELSNLKLNFDKQSNAELQNQIILQDRLNKLRRDSSSDPKTVLIAQEALSQSTAKIAQTQMKYEADVANVNIKNQKLRLDGLESIRKRQADLAFSEIESANKIALIKLDAEDKLIQAKLSLGRISETTAARMTAKLAQDRFEKELDTQSKAEKKLQEEEFNAKLARADQLNSALTELNREQETERVEAARKAQEEIDKLRKTPVSIPGQDIPGSKSQDVIDTGIAQQVEKLNNLQEVQNKQAQETRNNFALQDSEATSAANRRVAEQGALNTLKKQELQYAFQIGEQQAKLNQLSKDQAFYTEMAESAAKSFAAGLTDAGKAMGDVIKLFAQTATITEKYNIERLNAEKAIADKAGKTAEDQKRDVTNLNQLDAKYYASKLDGAASIASASAGLFDKDSKTYKQLMSLEKAFHLMKIAGMVFQQAMFLKDWVVRMTSTKAEMALTGTKNATDTGSSMFGSLGKMFGFGGPSTAAAGTASQTALVTTDLAMGGGAMAGNAATTAATATGGATAGAAGAGGMGASLMAAGPYVLAAVAVYKLLGLGDKKPPGPTPEELASVSGTGMRYNAAGKLEATGTGALGDAKAANESIAKSIDYLGKINYENLQFDKNKALVALEAIRDNTENFVNSIGATGKIGDMTAGGVELNKKSGFLGFSSSATSLAASGVIISGTIGQIADGLGGSVKKFEDIRTQTSKWWGLKTRTTIDRSYQEVNQDAKDFLQATVGSFRAGIQASAAAFGQDGGILKPIIDQMDISFTAYQTGETSADFAKRVEQELGNKLDLAFKTVFPGIENLANRFQNFGETLSEFAFRVQGDSEQIKFAFQSIGQAYITKPGTDAMIQREYEQSLIKAFGGSQELFSAIDKYGNSMLTEAERLAPVRDNVNKKLLELFPALQSGGKSLITTREEFNNLRKTLDPLSPATADLWAQMTRLGPAFASVTEEANNLAETELKKAKQDQLLTILALKNDDISKLKALTLTRQRELDAMDDLLKPNQLYIYALQDEAAAKDKLQTSYDKVKTAINSTIDSLKSQVTVLQDYKKNLQMSDKGNLTPQEAYAASKGQLDSAAALAQQTLGAGASKAEIAARDKAVSSLPNLIDQFLNQSRTSFASGDQYQADYSWVNGLLDTTTAQLTAQETDAERQLSVLNNSVSYLTTIDENTKTTASLMGEFIANQVSYETAALSATKLLTEELKGILSSLPTKVKGYASGGLAGRGINMVGEQGPELVDFASPGRVYTAGQTAAFGDNTALVAELKALRDEMSQLRSEQKEQTGHIIQSNYDANQKNAQAVSNVTENAIKQQTWKERSQVVIA